MAASKPLDLERLTLIAGGHTAFQLLWAGVELGLFDHLSAHPGLDRRAVSEALGIGDQPARILLTGLTALGLITKAGDGYRNAELTEQMLVKGKPGYAAPILGWQAHIVYPGLKHFLAALKAGTNLGLAEFPGEGETLYQRLTQHPELEKVFQDAMSALSRQANAHLLEAYDFGRFSHLIDAGGGDGTNAIALARRFPKLKVTVFDSPSVCRIAEANIRRAGLSDRVFTHAGDFLRDPFPSGIDAVIYCHILTIWSRERNLALLRKTYESLPPGGAALIFNMMADDDETGPLSTALGSPYFLAIATGEGMLYPWKDYEDLLRQAGFATVERRDGLPLNHGLIVATKENP